MPGAGLPSGGGIDGSLPGGSNGSSNGNGSVAGGSSGGGRQGSGSRSGGGSTAGGGSDPLGGIGNQGSGGMTVAERRAVLDARLEEGYAVFDGVILTERERAQANADAAGSSVMGTGAGGGDEGEGDGSDVFGAPGTEGGAVSVASANTTGAGGNGTTLSGGPAREGEFNTAAQPSFEAPADIPSGDDDDVVARQLREAAMHEPDPELREKLWDEYRKYTGLPQ